jgi:hypothetical protein
MEHTWKHDMKEGPGSLGLGGERAWVPSSVRPRRPGSLRPRRRPAEEATGTARRERERERSQPGKLRLLWRRLAERH